MIIGVDIGGTNTDVCVVDKKKNILAACKVTTTQSIEEGVVQAIAQVVKNPQAIEAVCVGTTHATNAILQGKELESTGLIRIAGHNPDIEPGIMWPDALRLQIIKAFENIPGGYECHGDPISSFDEMKTKEAIYKLLDKGVPSISVVGVFSPINPEQELLVKALIREIAGKDFPVTLSSDIGGIGFLERENATLLNSALKKVVRSGFQSLKSSLENMGCHAPLWMIHNDGSVMDVSHAIDFPIFTISCGQTNSFRGACELAKKQNGIVIDVGGTSSDIGYVIDGFAKRSCHAAKIGGVKLQFPMPDVLSLAIGGGSIIEGIKIGPESVARMLKTKAHCFGGDTLTLTDISILSGHLSIEGADSSKIPISKAQANTVLEKVEKEILRAVNIVRAKHKSLPLIAVGGGALFLKNIGCEIPPYADVANAYGAALAEISSTVDIVASLQERIRTLEEIKAKAVQNACKKGAVKESCRIVNMEVIPYAYSKNALARIIVTASGKRE